MSSSTTKADANKSKKDKKKEELNEEDEKLRSELESLVGSCCNVTGGSGGIKAALNTLSTKLKEASSTMTSVPKPLKFLRVHYEVLKKFYESQRKGVLAKDATTQMAFADILSVLAAVKSPPKPKVEESGAKDSNKDVEMKDAQKSEEKIEEKTPEEIEMSLAEKEAQRDAEKKKKEEGPFIPELNPYLVDKQRDCLKYRLEGTPNSQSSFTLWGHEYVRHLSGEILYCYKYLQEDEDDEEDVEMAEEGGIIHFMF